LLRTESSEDTADRYNRCPDNVHIETSDCSAEWLTKQQDRSHDSRHCQRRKFKIATSTAAVSTAYIAKP
jgi:hypothetical protein